MAESAENGRYGQLKAPPHNTDAELAVLGAMVTSPGAWEKLAGLLEPADFYRPANRQAFKFALEVESWGYPVDGMTLTTHAMREDRADVAMAVAEAAEAAISAVNLEHYAKLVRECRIERDLITAAMKIGDLGYENLPAAEKLNRAQSIIMGLSMDAKTAQVREIREVLAGVVTDVENRYQHMGQVQGLVTGYPDLDHRWKGLKPGNLVVLAGRPAMGKTTLAMNIVTNVVLAGGRAQVFSLEMSAEELVERAIASVGGVLQEDIETGNVMARPDGPEAFAKAVSQLSPTHLLIDDTAGIDMARIRARARQASVSDKLDLLVVDHLQLMSGEGFTRNDVVSNITKGLKNLAKELRLPVLLLSQLSREVDKRPYGKNRPILSDLRDSGSIEQDADIVAFVYRNCVYKPNCAHAKVAEVITSKFRNGKVGTDLLREDFEHSRFQSYSGPRPEYDTVEPAAGFDDSSFA